MKLILGYKVHILDILNFLFKNDELLQESFINLCSIENNDHKIIMDTLKDYYENTDNNSKNNSKNNYENNKIIKISSGIHEFKIIIPSLLFHLSKTKYNISQIPETDYYIIGTIIKISKDSKDSKSFKKFETLNFFYENEELYNTRSTEHSYGHHIHRELYRLHLGYNVLYKNDELVLPEIFLL